MPHNNCLVSSKIVEEEQKVILTVHPIIREPFTKLITKNEIDLNWIPKKHLKKENMLK